MWPDTIMTPLHVHSVKTEGHYRAMQRAYIAKGRAKFHALNWKDPWTFIGVKPDVMVDGGKLLVKCECGNYPSVHPEWKLALCFECGAIYEGLEMPPNLDKIEKALAKRKHPAYRGWVKGETVEDLDAQTEKIKVVA